MIAAETPRLAIPVALAAPSPSLFERLGALISRAAQAAATEEPAASDEAVWTSIARGL